jgi:hypothetical protein
MIRRAAPLLVYVAAILIAVAFASNDAVVAVAVLGAVMVSLWLKAQGGWE